ncbi:MAG: ABC transporter permease subunit [bacterium]|nr:ABC transporter permease subunit [bacterium]
MLANVFTKTFQDRWRGVGIASISLAALLALAMAVYREFDLSFYDDMPEVFRSMVGIPDGADAAGLSIGVLYGLYGAFTLAGLAISMGSASIAGEESSGTMGLLLGNPKSRTHILASKGATLVALSALGTLFLWGAAHLVADFLNVSVTGMHVGSYSFHLFANTLFYGFLAFAIGAWTGSRAMASGVTAGLMIVGFMVAGIAPLVEGWENVAKVFPWYYFDGADPIGNGPSWGHLTVLLGGSALLAGIAQIGLNRRDLRSQTVGENLVDRLRANPMTKKVFDRLAGSTRVSRIWIKTASEHQGLLIITAYMMFFLMGVLMGPLYGLMDESLLKFSDQIPEAMYAFVGSSGGNMSTAEGFYELETFGMMAPIAVIVVGVVIGSQALAGEEAKRTMGLLLSNPLKRSTVVLEKTYAMIAYAVAVGVFTWAGVWIGSLLGRLGMSPVNIAAASLLATLVGLVFGALSLVLSAATGRVKIAVFGTVGVALATYLINSIAILNDTVEGLAVLSPFNYYLTSDPLNTGMHWGNAAVLLGTTGVLILAAVWLFDRRDLRQTG